MNTQITEAEVAAFESATPEDLAVAEAALQEAHASEAWSDEFPIEWTLEQIHESQVGDGKTVQEADLSAEGRKKLADKGHAKSDGSFPIPNTSYLKKAIEAIGRAKSYSAAKAWIIKRAKALGAVKMLPPSWGVQEAEGAPDYESLVAGAIAEAASTAADESKAGEEEKGDAPMVYCAKHGGKVKPTTKGTCPTCGANLKGVMQVRAKAKASVKEAAEEAARGALQT